jgi:glycosyltransferase involved in cell wall biosynthesis
MKGIYYYISNDLTDSSSGIEKKINMQFSALKNENISLEIIAIEQKNIIYKIIRRIPFLSSFTRSTIRRLFEVDIENLNFIYIRKSFFDKRFLKICKRIKLINPELKLIIEIPTYPYDHEWNKLIDKGILIKDKNNRNKLYKYVDRIVTLSNDDDIFGIKTIKIQNGIDVNKVILKSDNTQKNEINLIGVAVITFWHGYDRLIKGLIDYYKNAENKKIIIFNIVGEGVELDKLKKMVVINKLEDKVIFHGKKFGKDLDNLFDKCDIAVGSLGIHRINLSYVSTLKAKEYFARGIPFIKSHKEIDFTNETSKYFLEFPGDESNIEIQRIIDFYSKNFINNDIYKLRDNMREYAVKNFTWNIKIRPVIDYLKS